MLIARSVLVACLRVFAGLCAAAAGLLALLVVVQHLRGDFEAAPGRNAIAILAALALGAAARWAASRTEMNGG